MATNFYRGSLQAKVLPDGSLRIEGLRIRSINGQKGLTIHPVTAKHLAKWMAETLTPADGSVE